MKLRLFIRALAALCCLLGSTGLSAGGGPLESPPEAPQGLAPLIKAARADLAQRLGVTPNTIEVVAAEQLSWPDTSMGCPREGYQYTQVITPGARIVLRAGGRNFHYHSGGRQAPTLCELPRGLKPGPHPPGDI